MSFHEQIMNLEQVDWNFADYSSSQFPTDINSLHWYPAAFVPQIPAILINSLSNESDVVLDPFAGSGTTVIEASRLSRRFIGIDRNPYAIHICKAKFDAIGEVDENWLSQEETEVKSLQTVKDPKEYCALSGIDDEILKWFEQQTLSEILTVHQHIIRHHGTEFNLLRQVFLSSILNRCCSQKDHYTYITDRCFPKDMICRQARAMYIEQIRIAGNAIAEARRQFQRIHGRPWKPSDDGVIKYSDARVMDWIEDSSIDLVVTSPPYLGVNDYARSMRLTWLLFPEEINEAFKAEIGARRKRQRPKAYEEYIQDMKDVFKQIARILKTNGYLSLVIGQGKGRVNKENVIDVLLKILKEEHSFSVLFQKDRRIKFRRIQVPGVGTERIIVLKRQGVL